MALTDLKVRSIKPTDKAKKISDGAGLILHVTPAGGKYWRFNYRYDGKQKTLSFGVYPQISLSEARKKRLEAKQQLSEGIDPGFAKQAIKQQKEALEALLFENIARQWWASQLPRWKDTHAKKLLQSLESEVFPTFGEEAITDIKTPDILALIRKIEARGVNDTAIRCLQRIKSVFNYAIQIGLIEHNPAVALTGVILKKKEQNQLALPQADLPLFFKRLNDTKMHEYLRIGLTLQVLWFVRSGELRHAQWREFDLERREWHIPADKMKMKRTHIVPLSAWAMDLLEQLRELTGESPYLFPNARDWSRPMSENALGYAMQRMGFKGIAVPHGFRSLATDVLNENGFNADVIERQLAHVEGNKVRAAYHRTEYLPKRHEMMEWYSEWIKNHLG